MSAELLVASPFPISASCKHNIYSAGIVFVSLATESSIIQALALEPGQRRLSSTGDSPALGRHDHLGSMIRDPFNIHRKKPFGATAFQAAQIVTENVVQAGTEAIQDMTSFSIPRNLPNFNDPSRELEDRAWSSFSSSRPSNKGVMNGVQSRVTGMFDKGALPMYKDKPYAYAPSLRKRPWWRRKRILGSTTIGLLFFLYLFGFFNSESSRQQNGASKSSWLWQSADKTKHDWNKRREMVVEAFELSWDAYARYAWGQSGASTPGLSPGSGQGREGANSIC